MLVGLQNVPFVLLPQLDLVGKPVIPVSLFSNPSLPLRCYPRIILEAPQRPRMILSLGLVLVMSHTRYRLRILQ